MHTTDGIKVNDMERIELSPFSIGSKYEQLGCLEVTGGRTQARSHSDSKTFNSSGPGPDHPVGDGVLVTVAGARREQSFFLAYVAGGRLSMCP